MDGVSGRVLLTAVTLVLEGFATGGISELRISSSKVPTCVAVVVEYPPPPFMLCGRDVLWFLTR